MTRHSFTVLISGEGSNLQALIDACTAGRIDADIVQVVSNRKDANGLNRAKNSEIPTYYQNLVKYRKEHADLNEDEVRGLYDSDLAKAIMSHNPRPELIVCAGFMHILKPTFLDPLGREGIPVINRLHPALPGQFDGAHAIERAYEAFEQGKVTETGCMIHYVIAEVDRGPPIIIRKVPIQKGDTLNDLSIKIRKQELDCIVAGTNAALEKLEKK